MKPATISEIQITPVKPNSGHIAFCSFVLFESVYCSSVAIFTRPDGSYRLLYPTKKLGNRDIDIFHPINNQLGKLIETEVSKKLEEVMNHGRYDRNYIA